jgi:hypothetical protein
LNKDATVNSLIAPDSWVRLKASRVEGAKFTIEADDKEFCGDVNWLVIGERNDKFVQANPLINEKEKEKEGYLHPSAFEG